MQSSPSSDRDRKQVEANGNPTANLWRLRLAVSKKKTGTSRRAATLVSSAVTLAIVSLASIGVAMSITGLLQKEPSSSTEGEVDLTPSEDASIVREKFPVQVNRPSGPPQVHTGMVDAQGRPVTVSCRTCHTTRLPDVENRTGADLKEFHQGIDVVHGTISCLSCHNPNDYDTLRLADGETVEFSDVMTLCAQCHGPQMRDFEHGAHGGFTGFWDSSRGAKVKNNCVDCHHPHAPKFLHMEPTFKPRDRFLEPADH